jgi:hypothetical protein
MWKKLTLIILVLALISGFIFPIAEAGVKKKLKYLAVLGLLPPPPIPAPVGVYSPPIMPYCPPPQEYITPGHWETIREWVPGTWERVWIPGYYDHWKRWVPGHYEDRQTPGYYSDRRVWIEEHYRPY